MTDIDVHDNIVSSRFFHYTSDQVDPWPLINLDGIHGGDENCNRTIGFRHPWGMTFLCLNIPLRQKPHRKCLAGYNS